MRLIHSLSELRQALADAPRTSFVPTMGNLHAGHIDLVRQARLAGGPVVVSIFVNPLQFGQGEDFERYPRTLDADCAQLEPAGTDIVFCPEVHEMYPEAQTFQVQPPLADELCGAFRPGHFQGVCTVVLKLFEMVRPKIAVFGKKDYQQLHLLKGMTRQFNLDIAIIEAETLRADDGLALSSRNGYLSPAERTEAPRLYRLLQECASAVHTSQRDFAAIEAGAARQLAANSWRVDYVSIRSQATLLAPHAGESRLVILAAARLGNTRLIDNLELNVG
jgi:pantoate--beta-alanine ligase